jgi:hypothetical protein
VPPRLLTAALAACLFTLIVAAKWAVFERFGSPMPDWDQWDAEAVELLIPWYEGDHFLSHLFHPHNEHRVVMTKLQNLALCLANGQWDSRVEASTNAMLHAAIAAGLWLFARRRLAAAWHAPLFVVLLALFGLPFAWQNVLGGFHSQQYWLVGLSLLAMGLLPHARPWSAGWWVGAAACALALLSMGSGLLAGAVVVLVCGWRWLRAEIGTREAWPTLVVALACVATGLVTRVDAPWHAHMKAKSASDFVLSMLHSLQWPWRDQNWLVAVLWLPWVLVVIRILRWPRTPAEGTAATTDYTAGQRIAAMGGWVMAQVLATAYARGAGADYPASRYMDALALGAAANALALGWLLSRHAGSATGRNLHRTLGLAWLAALGFGLHPMVHDNFTIELPDAKKYYLQAEANLRRYLATKDPVHLADRNIPYPSADALIERLARPSLRTLMPVPLRTPLPLLPDAGTRGGFVENDARWSARDQAPHRGLPATTTPLDHGTSWGSHSQGTGTWRSRPVTPSLPAGWLRFETTGQIGEPGITLELHDAASGRFLSSVAPSKVPGNVWRSAYVPKPSAPFVVVARDTDPARWLAFSGPIEMGPLSYWAWQANKHGLLILQVTAGVTLLLGLTALLDHRRARP